jgi:hypothetical protein
VELALEVDEDTTPAGFTDGLRASGRALGWLAALLVLLAGALLPFIWVVPVALGARLWWRRRRHAAAPSGPGASGPGSDTGPSSGPTAPGGTPMGAARPVDTEAGEPGVAPREPVGAPSGPPPPR